MTVNSLMWKIVGKMPIFGRSLFSNLENYKIQTLHLWNGWPIEESQGGDRAQLFAGAVKKLSGLVLLKAQKKNWMENKWWFILMLKIKL